MSTENRAPGATGEGVSDDKLRLERYAIFMTFDDDATIPIPRLADQWQVKHQTVSAMVSGAKRMLPDGPFANELADAGYRVAELPKWFGESAEVAGAVAESAEVAVAVAEVAVAVAEVAEEAVYPARTPLPIAQEQPGAYKPATATATATLAKSATPATATAISATAPTSGTTTLTPQQVQLLAKQGITYDQDHHTWVRVVPQGKGQYVEAVDPIATLRVLEAEIKSEQERADMASGIADDLLDTVKLQTQAILKKVALNPSVFQCYQYVSNVRDPDTNKVLYGGDFGDYISWAVIFATRVFYGVEPSFQINLPSIYTRHKQQRSKMEQPQMQAYPVKQEASLLVGR